MTDIRWPNALPPAPSADEQRLRQIEQALDTRMDESLRMHPSPELEAADPVSAAQAELASTIHAAGGFPHPDVAAYSEPVSDPAAAELLAPATDEPFAGIAAPSGTDPGSLTFEQAMQRGVIPAYADQPDDVADAPDAPPVDPAVERTAWEQLIAYIRANKDPGTTITMMNPDTFTKGLA